MTLIQNLTILTSFFENKNLSYHKDTPLKSSLVVLYISSVSDFLFSSIFIQCHVKYLVKNDIKQIDTLESKVFKKGPEIAFYKITK